METFSRLTIEQVCTEVGLSDLAQGLSDKEVMDRRIKNGPNKLPDTKSGFVSKAKSFIIENRQIMAFIGAMVLFVFTIRHDSSASLCAHLFFVIFSIIPALYRYYGSFKEQLQSAAEEDEKTYVAVRRGIPNAVKQEYLVVGDVVILKAGDPVPADIRIVEATNLSADESAISGYSEVRPKSSESTTEYSIGEAECLLFMGTKLVEGSCKGIVVATGTQTIQWQLNQIASDYGFTYDSLTKQQSRLIVYSLYQILLGIALKLLTGSDESMKYLLVSAIILLKIVDNMGISRPLGDKILTERLLDNKVIARSMEKAEFIKDIDCIYLRAGDLVKSEQEATKVFVDGEMYRIDEAPVTESLVTLCRYTNLATSGLIESSKEGKLKVIGSKLEGAVLKFTNKIESLLVSRSQTNVVCFAGQKKDGCLTFLRRTGDGYTLAIFGPLGEVAKRCDRMIHKGKTVPYNPQLVEQAAGKDEVFAVVYANYDFNRFSVEALEVSFDDLPQTNLIMAGFFTVEALTNNTDFPALKNLSRDYQVKIAFHSDLPADKTLQILRKTGLAKDPVSTELGLPYEEGLALSTTALIDGHWLHQAIETGRIGQVKRILSKPVVAIYDMKQVDHPSVLRILQDLGFSVVALCTQEDDNEDFKRADFSVSFAFGSHDSCKFSSDLVLLDEDLSKLVEVKALAEVQEKGIDKVQVSILAFYLPVLASILLATVFEYRLSTMLLFCVEMGSVMIPVFSLGFVHVPRLYHFNPLQTMIIVTFASIYTFAFALADYGYFGGDCLYPEGCNKKDAFYYAQSAFFISIIMTQWASSALLNLDETLTPITHMHWSSVHMSSVVKLIMGLLLCFIPQLNLPIHTKPTRLQHFGFPGVLFFAALFVFDLVRTKILRRG